MVQEYSGQSRGHMRMGQLEFNAIAEPATDTGRVADFINLRVKQHPVMLWFIMFIAVGLLFNFTRVQLERYRANRVMVILQPVEKTNNKQARFFSSLLKINSFVYERIRVLL